MMSPVHRNRSSRYARKRKFDNLTGYVFIAPWLAGFFAFIIIPIVISLVLSFTNYDLLSAPKWTGILNFKRMFFQDDKYWQSVKVTIETVVASVPIRLAFALYIAVHLSRRRALVGAYRGIYYLPSIIGGSVAVSVTWRQLFGNDGPINFVLALLGNKHPIVFLGEPNLAIWTIILLMVWQFGSSMLIFLAGLKNIPQSYYEAATVDGAHAAQRFFRITLPMLSPVIFFNLVMQTIGSFLVFTPAYIITNGGPLDATLMYALYLYEEGFQFFHMGYASAMAWVMLLLIAAVTGILFRTSRSWVYYESKVGRR